MSTEPGETFSWPDDTRPEPERLHDPTGPDQAFAIAAAGSLWVLPVIGPLLIRLFARERPFAQHWARVSLYLQLVYVGLFVMGAFIATQPNLKPVLGWIGLAGWVFGLYASVMSLVKILRRRVESVYPVPLSLVSRP